MSINFNQSPYWDDHSDDKNFYRVLFRPGFAVQARELTQAQTILQRQIDKFGKHVFKEGSLVTGGQLLYDRNASYIKLQPQLDGTDIAASDFTGMTLVGDTSGAKIYVIKGVDIEDSDPNTIIGALQDGLTFIGGEDLKDVATGDTVATIATSNFIGSSSLFSITEGIFFARGVFAYVGEQTIVLDKYTNDNSYIIGLSIVESTINSSTDESLLDNAQGSYNFAAPGADRYRITLTLDKINLSDVVSTDFIELARLSSGNFIKRVIYPTYAELEKTMARRTYDESGDYTVRSFPIQISDHAQSNADLLTVGLGAGKAYVKGFEFETISTSFIDLERARDTDRVGDESIVLPHGNFLYIKDVKGFIDTTDCDLLEIHNIAANATMTDATRIGYAKAKYLKFDESSANSKVGNNEFKLYISGITITNGSIADAESLVVRSGNTVIVQANIDLESKTGGLANGNVFLSDTNFGSLIFPIPSSAVETVRDSGGQISNSYNFQRSFKNVTFTNGVATITTSSSNERFLPGIGTLSSTNKQQHFHVVCKTTGTSQFASKEVIRMDYNTRSIVIAASSGSPGTATLNVANTSWTFTADIIADITVSDIQERVKTTATGNTVITSPNLIAGSIDSVKHSDVYEILSVHDLKRTVTSTGANNYTLTFSPTAANNIIVRVNGVEKTYGTHYTANSTHVLFTSGNVPALSATIKLYDSITSSYGLYTGQKDTLYDHGGIKLLSNATLPTGSEVYAKFKYFAHSGTGFITVDSYTDINYTDIPTYTSPTTGTLYTLRDSIDYRPRRVDNDLGGTTGLDFSLTGGQLPDPDSSITTTWSYYLPRIDKIIVTKNKEFSVVRGISSLNPTVPSDSSDAMTLYVLGVPAYTSSPSDVTVRYIENKRYTMRDIGRLEKRIENLEYYTALSLLEKQASDQSIIDVNGMEIYKNGILVDSFSGHSIGDVSNLDYNCSIDFTNRLLRPSFESRNYRFTANTSGSTNIARSGNIITLDYNDTPIVEQPLSSKAVNVNPFNIPNWTGTLVLDPPSDTWYDTETRPDVLVNLTGDNDAWAAIGQAFEDARLPGFGTQWNDWQTSWVGEDVIGTKTMQSLSNVRNSNIRIENQAWGYWILGDLTTTQRSTVEVTTAQTRTGVRTTIVPETITSNLGNRVVNVSIIPYIRAQTILGISRGLRPSTRIYPFFDGTSITNYVTPANILTLTSITGTFDDSEGVYESVVGGTSGANGIVVLYEGNRTGIQIVNVNGTFSNGETITGTVSGATATISGIVTSNTGSALYTNSSGELAFVYALPNNDTHKFRTGDRMLRLIDNNTNSVASATTTSESTFTASGLLQTVESTVVSTRQPVIKRFDLRDERVQSSVITRDVTVGTTTERVGWWDPLAQTFLVDSTAYPDGIYATRAKLFFKAKDDNLPVTLQLRPVVNGYPSSSTVIPFSEVVKMPTDIKTADVPDAENANTYTTFTFPSPVYLPPGEYGIVVLTNSMKYEAHVAEVGSNKTGTEDLISKQPYAGALFKSQNGSTWIPEVNEDLMFVLDKADFESSGSAIFELNGADPEFQYDVLNVDTSVITPGDSQVVYSFKTTSNTGTLDSSYTQFMMGQNQEFTTRRKITEATGSLKIKADLYTSSSDVSPSIDLTRLHATFVKNVINNLPVENIIVTDSGSSYESAPSVNITGVGTSAAATANTTTSNTVNTVAISNGGSGYYETPVISITGGGGNNATAVAIGETSSSGGNGIARYITRRVTLADGFDAKNLQVYFEAYKPQETNIYVYYKVLAGDDSDLFDSKDYVIMSQSTPTSTISTAKNQYFEYKYVPTTDTISYTTDNGATFNNFKTFAIKIVMSSSNPCVVPMIRDLRVIALDA